MTFSARPLSGLSAGPGPSNVAAVRIVTGSPVTADASADPPLATDAAFPPEPAATSVPIDCAELATVWVAVEMSNDGSQLGKGDGSILLDQLWRDPAAADGFRWKRPNFGTPSSPVAELLKLDSGGAWIEMRVDGCVAFPRIDTVTGTADTVVILAKAGEPRISNRKFQ
jgi:hypothetical protein